MKQISDWLRTHRWPAATGLALLAAAYVLVAEVAPQAVEARRLIAEQAHRRARLELAAGWGAEVARLDAERRRMERAFSARFVSLPQSGQASLVLHALQEAADSAGVLLEEIRPIGEEAHAVHQELSLQLRLTGRFHAALAFVNALERSRYLIKVEEVEIASSLPERPHPEYADAESPSAPLEARLLLGVVLLDGGASQNGGGAHVNG